MGKKRTAILGSPDEDQLRAKKETKREQKKLREGQKVRVPGLKGGQRVVDTTAETLAEYEKIMQKANAQEASPKIAPAKTQKTRLRSKTYLSLKSQVSSEKSYPVPEAVTLLRKISIANFDPTVELHLVLRSNPPSKVSVSLPHAHGKPKKVAVATDEVVSAIESGKIDFDVLVASPAQMPKLVKFAKILGPKGLMPNPKTGTISDKPEETAKKLRGDTSIALKPDKSGLVIHTAIGKLSFNDKQLEENISAVLSSVSGNLKKAILKSTMSPAIKLQA